MNYLAGGVNSPIPTPPYFPPAVKYGSGAIVMGSDGREYIDLWMGYGALLFGHADNSVRSVIEGALKNGWFFSIPRTEEVDLAAALHEVVPCAERVRFATTGSDAVMYAIRAARAFTGRSRILMMCGGYHGANEGFIQSAGLAVGLCEQFQSVPFNNTSYVKNVLETRQYAALLIEPVLANNGCVPPQKGYLNYLRAACTNTGTVLIFDEVVTGFRLATGGAQQRFQMVPDLCTFSKALAGGFPLSAVCGKGEILENYIPSGKVFFAGTFNAHPISLKIALHIIRRLITKSPFEELDDLGDDLRAFIRDEAYKQGIRLTVQGIGSMLSIGFGIDHFEHGLSESSADRTLFKKFIVALAKKGVLHPPLATETIFLSPVHRPYIGKVKDAFRYALRETTKNG